MEEMFFVLLKAVLIILITFLTITNKINPALAISLAYLIGMAKIEND